MKHTHLLNYFKVFSKYHIFIAIITHLTMILSFYVILSLSFEKKLPKTFCPFQDSSNNSSLTLCSMENFCSQNNTELIKIHIKNWTSEHQLYCDKSIYFSYITSTIFACSILSSLIMSIVADKKGRKFSFILEVNGNLISFIILYYENSITMIFIGIIFNEIFSHVYNTAMIYVYEYFPLNIYIILIILHNIGYGFIGLIASIYVEIYKETKTLTLIVIVISAICLICGIIGLTESPEWLIDLICSAKDKKSKDIYVEKLKSNFHFLCKFNNDGEKYQSFCGSLSKMEYLNDDEYSCKSDDYTHEQDFVNLSLSTAVRNKDSANEGRLYRHLILAVFLWITNQIIFYSTLTNLASFEDQIKHSFSIFFLSHIVANILIVIITSKIGMNKTIIYSSATTAAILVIMFNCSRTNTYLQMVMFFVFNCSATINCETIYLFIPHLFEPKIRSTATSYTKIPSKILLILSPFVIGTSLYSLYYVFLLLTGLTPLLMLLMYK